MNELAYKIAPFIRGLSFDGNKGKIVTFSEENRSTPNSINLEALTEENYQDRLQKAFKEGTSSITIESVGTFYLSETYDGAKALSEGKAAPKEEKVKADRNNIVKNKTALVTGGAQGFGEGMVRGLAEAGAFVYIADMNLEGAEKLAASLNREQGRTCACAIAVNVTSEESVEAMMNQVALTTGGLDLFVSNAGVLKAGSVKEMTLKDFSFVTNVDYTGFFICTKYAARQMAIQNSPVQDYFTDIICISSKSGLEGSNKNGAYAGAKFGVIGLTQSFALELVADKIKVNALCPGNFLDGPLWSDPERGLFVQYLNTGKVPGAKTLADVRKFYEAKVPLNRGCTTEDVMKALFYTVDQKYETGQAIPITGGQLMLN
jgi:sorbitol-6-phosphate 2-dehydrogenase